ncbi:ISLre2 family transposase [Enterococcus sp. 5B3_DIV0040]|uniref:ISLre2 family transposase n=1 Tax=Enterococcus sp. 5B3_DIV0040 TaxID=1834182 RepID=UPI000A3598B2|nr:ISLre2 family transposase [Enterococcus sp. 5B3_DIV0040]OTO02273.1 hypothetical protein A5883_003100 [Enterococcus sp. 5B3_DIV0040]
MQAYFQQMDQILSQEPLDPIEKERKIQCLMNTLIEDYFQQYINYKENSQRSYYQAQGYQPEKKAVRTVHFLFGSITYARTPWKKGGEILYPVDELFQVTAYERYSPGVTFSIAKASKNCPYRKVSTMIEDFTLISCSKDTVGKAVRAFGQKAANHFSYQRDYGEAGKRKVPYLFLEGDGVLVNEKGLSSRGRKTNQGPGKKKELSHFVIHEGIDDLGNQTSRRLKQARTIISSSYAEAVHQVKDYLYQTYDLTETIVVANTDGGKGFTKTKIQEVLPAKIGGFEYFIDRYHVTQKLIQRVFKSELIDSFQEAINAYDPRKRDVLLTTLESCCETQEQWYQYTKLKGYLYRNWPYLKPYYLRNLPKKKQGIGIMESRHRSFTYRMKNQGKYWGRGLEGMIQLIASEKNQTMKTIFLQEHQNAFALDERLKGQPLCGFEQVGEPENDGITKGVVRLQTDRGAVKEYVNWLKKGAPLNKS